MRNSKEDGVQESELRFSFRHRVGNSPALAAAVTFSIITAVGVILLAFLSVALIFGGETLVGRLSPESFLIVSAGWLGAAGIGALASYMVLVRQRWREVETQTDIKSQRTKALLDAVFEASYLPILVIDPDREEVIEGNHAASELFGFDFQKSGPTDVMQFQAGNENAFRSFIATAAEHGSAKSDNFYCQTRSEERIPVEIFVSFFELDGQKLLTAVVRDLRQAKAAEEALIRARDEAERASRIKSQFLASMSHELRTPLNAINGFSKIILDEIHGELGNDKYREYLSDIHNSGTHLLSQINDILVYTRIEAGDYLLREDSVDVARVVSNVMQDFQNDSGEKAIQFSSEIDEKLPRIWADPRALKHVISILLSNAAKFSKPGGAVSVKAGKRSKKGEFFLKVTDEGIGIPDDKVEAILKPFQQLDGDHSRKFSGAGLGLPLSAALIELHQGSLQVESVVDVGTTVTITLPKDRLLTGERPQH